MDSIVFQIADVNKPLMCISALADNGCRFVLDQHADTGEDLMHYCKNQTKKKIQLKRVGMVWILDCTGAKYFLADNSLVISRPCP